MFGNCGLWLGDKLMFIGVLHRRGERFKFNAGGTSRTPSPTDKSIKNRFTVKKLHIKLIVGDGALDVLLTNDF